MTKFNLTFTGNLLYCILTLSILLLFMLAELHHRYINIKMYQIAASVVVSMLAFGTQVRGFKPGRSRWIFSLHEKILSMPSFEGEVKESVSCPSFAACKRTQYFRELRMC
jgi:hypothetical protein